jgi:hypothetical protein
VGHYHRQDGRRAGHRAAPAFHRNDGVLDRRAGVDDEIGGIGQTLAGRMRGRLVEIILAGDGDDEQAALLGVEGGFDAGRIASAVPEDDDRIAFVERLVVEEFFGVVFRALEPQQFAYAAGAEYTLCRMTRGSVSGLKPT